MSSVPRLGLPLGAFRSGPQDGFDRRLVAPMVLGSVLNPINSSIIAVSLVPIGMAFGAPTSQTLWLVSALYLATAIGQPVVGRLVDAYGPRRLFLAGATLTGVAGLMGTVAPSMGVLIVARVVLGFGTCAGYPAAMYLIRSEATRTGRDSPAAVLTVLAIASQTIAVIGPTMGGLLIGLGGWRATFAVNLPLAIAGVVLGRKRLPKTTTITGREGPSGTGVAGGEGGAGGLDYLGIALFAAMMSALLVLLMNPHNGNWAMLVLTVVAAAGFTAWELSASNPFLDLRVLGRNAALLATYVRNLLAMTVSYAFLYGYAQWLEESRHLSATQTGLILLPLSLVAIIVASATGRHPAVRGKLIVGAAAQVVGCALLLFLHSASPVWLLVGVAVTLGIPQGLNSLANQNAVYHQADPVRMGSSAGLLRTFMYLGAMVASAANGLFFGHRADTGGLHQLATFMLVVAGLFLAITVADRSLSRIGRR